MRGSRLLPVLAAGVAAVTPLAAHAQSFSIDLGQASPANGMTGHLVQLTALVTLLSLAPSLLVTLTAFTRIIIVLSLLRSALGAQGTPPNQVLIGLALFLTFFVMEPTLEQSWTQGVSPMIQGHLDPITGLTRAADPFHAFMSRTVRPSDLQLFLDIGHVPPPSTPETTPWRILVPSFLVGELRRAFEMGFLIYLPFLVIDVVVSSILMSLGMMMLPPNSISLPFKLIFFVLVDGWHLVAGSLVESFGPH